MVMRGTVARRWFSGAVGLLLLLLLPACATASGEDLGTPVPIFEVTSTSPSATVPDPDPGLPTDCERILTASDLGALLGLPLDSVVSRSTIGQPAPAVGRTERVACSYSATGSVGDRPRGAALLDVNSATYVDAAAAAAQWQVNLDVEDGAVSDVALGAARAALVERPGETVLMVAHDAATITLVLPDEVRVGDVAARDTLVDLALRVLPPVAGAGQPTTTPTPTTTDAALPGDAVS